jgi:glycosyltransferase involved in cell wall biosynthesis
VKIFQITPSYKPAYVYGGPTMSVAKLCEALSNEQLDLQVLTTTANGQSELDVEPNKQVKVDGVLVTYYKRITKDHTHFSPALLKALRNKIKSTKPIIHIHSWWNLVTIFSCFVAKLYHVPVVLSPRGMLTNYTQNTRNSFFKSTLHFLLGKSLLKYVHIIASSEQEKSDVLEIITPKSIHIIPNLVSLPKTIPTHESEVKDNNSFNLLFLSRIEEKKGLDFLFDALANLTVQWTLTIGGDGEKQYVENLKAKAENLKINNNINWLGHVNNDNKFKLIANHDLLVLTSHNENFANVVIESLSVGTPVLLSKHVGLSSYVEDNDLGFITDLKVDQITAKLNEAFTSIEKRNRIRQESPPIIQKDFNEITLVKKYIALYHHILNLD